MTFHYYPDTDSLYIDLSEKTSVDSESAQFFPMIHDLTSCPHLKEERKFLLLIG